jgi:ubiquinone/menaquinone biosynthesis C-methylase UbiE
MQIGCAQMTDVLVISPEFRAATDAISCHSPPPVPAYLIEHYWWAYIHPKAVKLFDRQWLVNLILWGNYARLRDAALTELGYPLSGKTLQVACVYGDLTEYLSRSAKAGRGAIDIIDVLPIQLSNLRSKLPGDAPVNLLAMDAVDLRLPPNHYDRALVFFLLHEQPRHYRERTVREVLRVLKPGGKMVIVDYARPRWWHPLRYLLPPFLRRLEPFALDLWREEIADCLFSGCTARAGKHSFFGGLYRMLVITR